MDRDFRIELQVEEDTQVIAVHGDVDIATASHLSKMLRGVCEDGAKDVVLDLRGVNFLDSVGLRAMLEAMDVCQKHDAQFVVVPNPIVHRLFEVTGLLDALPWREV
jgi:anti-sigma B factor antagonist